MVFIIPPHIPITYGGYELKDLPRLRAGRLGVFSCFYLWFLTFVSIALFGIAGRPRSRPLGVDSGPGEGGPGGPEPRKNTHVVPSRCPPR